MQQPYCVARVQNLLDHFEQTCKNELPQWLKDHKNALWVLDLELLFRGGEYIATLLIKAHEHWVRMKGKGDPDEVVEGLREALIFSVDSWLRTAKLFDLECRKAKIDEYDTTISLDRLTEISEYFIESIQPDLDGEFDEAYRRLAPDRLKERVREAQKGDTTPLDDVCG